MDLVFFLLKFDVCVDVALAASLEELQVTGYWHMLLLGITLV